MRHRETTLNAWDAQFWMQVPLPLAEVGSRLSAAGADYLDRLLELLEDGVALATALALTRITAVGPASTSLVDAVHAHLEQPSLGKRIALISIIERAHPGTCGWDLDADAADLADLLAGARGGAASTARVPLRSVLHALTTIRNDDAHRRLSASDRVELARVVELIVLEIIRRNRAFYERVLYVDQARLTPTGGTELTAKSLNGPVATSYRRGNWQTIAARRLLPGRVYIGDSDELVDAHPFLVMRGEQVFVLDQMRASGPVLRHFVSRSALAESTTSDLAVRWRARSSVPEGPLVAPTDSVTSRAPSLSRARARGPLLALGAMALIGVAALIAVSAGRAIYVAAMGMTSATDAPGSLEGGEDRAPLPARCRGALPLGAGTGNTLPYRFAGAPIPWGATVADLEDRCDGATPLVIEECRHRLVEVRTAPGPFEIEVPQRNQTSLAFHRQRGLFEIMIYSSAYSTELAAAVEAHLGPHHREEGSRRFWEYEAGSTFVRVKVVGLNGGDARGRSAIKITRVDTAQQYQRDLEAAGCTR